MRLLAVPNVSEGRDRAILAGLAAAATDGGRAELLDLHLDPDHGRAVMTLAGAPPALPGVLAALAEATRDRLDIRAHSGVHPHVGTLDVVPGVHRSEAERGPALAAALVTADRIGELGIPVLLYGALGGGRTRAELRRGGPGALAARLQLGELRADFGPSRAHPRAGVVLLAARPPLVAFNFELAAGATLDDARRAAAAVREGGSAGLPGVRAIGLALGSAGIIQVSCNVEDHLALPLGELLAAVRREVPVVRAELVGMVPEAALAGWPAEIEIRGLDPARSIHERVLTSPDG